MRRSESVLNDNLQKPPAGGFFIVAPYDRRQRE